jgi:hypothetical protein
MTWTRVGSGWKPNGLKGGPETGRYAAGIKTPSQSSGLPWISLNPCLEGGSALRADLVVSWVGLTTLGQPRLSEGAQPYPDATRLTRSPQGEPRVGHDSSCTPC